jgi:hypothetical protein
MTGTLGFFLLAILVPILVGEARDLAPSLATWLLRWGARHIGQASQARRYEEEWLADLERVPGKATKLVHACGVLALSVPRLRAQLRRGPQGALLAGWIVDRTAEHLAGASELDASLQRVAELLVPRFADHCLIDLFQDSALIRRVQQHAGGWTPPAGTWAQVGEQIRYPEGHFCQRAMARLNTIIVADLAQAEESNPAPSAQSLATAQQIGLTSVLAAPLYSHGRLLGVMSIATSELTHRNGRFDARDGDLMGAMARQVSAAIGDTTTARSLPGPQMCRLSPDLSLSLSGLASG